MSAYFDTGSVLIESATDVFRVDAALATLGELIPGLRYFRSSPQQGPTQAARGTHNMQDIAGMPLLYDPQSESADFE